MKLAEAEYVTGTIDIFNLLGGKKLTKGKMFADGLHPNEEGADMIAKEVIKYVLEYKKEFDLPKKSSSTQAKKEDEVFNKKD